MGAGLTLFKTLIFYAACVSAMFAFPSDPAAQEISLHGFHPVTVEADDPAFATPSYDDRTWARIAVPSSLRAAGIDARPDVFWYRISFHVPKDWQSAAPAIRLGIITRSDETYLNGVRIGGQGIVGPAGSDWHAYAPTTPRLYSFDRSLLQVGQTNVLAIRGAREPYIDDGGIIAGPVALVDLPQAIGSFQALGTRFLAVRGLVAGVEALVALVLTSCLIVGIRSRLMLLFHAFYFPSFFYMLEYNGMLALMGFDSPALQFAANISGALGVPVLLQIIAQILDRPVGVVGRSVQILSILALISVPLTSIEVLDWWAIESNLVWHVIMLFGMGLASVWSVQALIQGKLYAGTVVAGIVCLLLGLVLDLIFPLNYFEQRIGLRIAEIGVLGLLLSLALVVLQSFVERERHLHAANADVGRLHEQDRARMANDVHDGIGQWLGAIRVKLELLGGHSQAASQSTPVGFDELLSDVDQVIEDTRRLSHDLSPGLLQEYGLMGAMRTNALHNQSILDIKFDIDTPNGVALDTAGQLHVYRIFQEALSNAVRHSGASCVQVAAKQDNRMFRLAIEDDGVWSEGIPRRPHPGAGLGLRSMYSRAALLGGSLNIAPVSGGGTSVLLTVPTRREGGHG